MGTNVTLRKLFLGVVSYVYCKILNILFVLRDNVGLVPSQLIDDDVILNKSYL